MKAVIMAGGLGSRLKPLTHIIPKPLLPLGERTILEFVIDRLSKHGFKDIIVATNFQSDLFEAYLKDGSHLGVNITYSKEEKSLGTVGPLSLLKEGLGNEPFLVVNGDILTNLNFKDLLDFHLKNNADLTITTKEIKTPFQYGIVHSEGGIVRDLEEKPNLKNNILAGIYILNPDILDFLKDGEHKHMTDLIRDVINLGKKVVVYNIKEYWLDVGIMENYKKAQEDKEKGFIG